MGIGREFVRYASLNILGQMAYSCYTLADTFFVSARLGADGLAALNLAFPVFCLINGTGMMIGMGGGAGYSISRGRNEENRADGVFSNAIFMAIFLSLLFFILGLFASGPIARLLGADGSVFEMTRTYLHVLLLFAPAFIFNSLLQCFVRNDGYPSLSMAAMIIGSSSNVVLDYLFIFPLDMGIFGAILATGLSPIISIGVLSLHMLKGRNGFHFRKASADVRCIGRILSSGASPFLTEAASGVVMFLFNFILLRLSGNTGVAAFSVITVISLVVVAIHTGLSQGIQPLLSRSYGRGRLGDARKVRGYAMAAMLAISVAIYGIIFFGADGLASIFNSGNDALLQSYAVSGMRLYFIACPFIGFNIILSTCFASMEQAGKAQCISLLRGFFVLIPTAFILSFLFGMTGVWCAYPAAEAIVAIIGALMLGRSHGL